MEHAQLDQGQRWDKHLMVIVGPVKRALLTRVACEAVLTAGRNSHRRHEHEFLSRCEQF